MSRGGHLRHPITARLVALIAETGLTQEAAAERIGVDQATLQRWLAGTRLPAVPQIEKLCRSLGVSGHYLITGEGPAAAPGRDSRADLAVRVVREELRRRVLGAVEVALATPAPDVPAEDASAAADLDTEARESEKGAPGKGKRHSAG